MRYSLYKRVAVITDNFDSRFYYARYDPVFSNKFRKLGDYVFFDIMSMTEGRQNKIYLPDPDKIIYVTCLFTFTWTYFPSKHCLFDMHITQLLHINRFRCEGLNSKWKTNSHETK